jgi:uncharacterized delta-60 repeat protein
MLGQPRSSPAPPQPPTVFRHTEPRVRAGVLAVCAIAVISLGPLLAQSPALDTFAPALDGPVIGMACAPDGHILVAGGINVVNGQIYRPVVSLLPDGQPDLAFATRWKSVFGDESLGVGGLAVLPTGTILAGSTEHLQILAAEGSLDRSVNYTFGLDGSWVYGVAMQPDGRVLVAAQFTRYPDSRAYGLLRRFNANGQIETTFNPQIDGLVSTLAVQPDGRILIGGSFTNVTGVARQRLARLNADGTLDTTFVTGADYPVSAIALQADNRILVGGSFSTLGGQSVLRLARLEPSGAVDTSFAAPVNGEVVSIVVQANGKILIGGAFSTVSGQTRQRIARLQPDGTLDAAFNPTSGDAPGASQVLGLALQADGKILAGGNFTNIAGASRLRVARFLNTDPATNSIVADASGITWLRSGSSPELSQVYFQMFTNGLDASPRLPAERVAGGWRAPGWVLPPGASIAVGGLATGGNHNGSFWSVQTFQGPPGILAAPQGIQTNYLNSITLEVAAAGRAPLTFQWFKDGSPLTNSSSILGAQSSRLSLASVTTAATGNYTVQVTGPDGSVTSRPAAVTVVDPCLVIGPASATVMETQTVRLDASAAGSGTLSFQWRRNGVAIPGATNAVAVSGSSQFTSTLSLAGATPDLSGDYDVVIRNAQGTLTTPPATVVVRRVVDRLATGMDPGVSYYYPSRWGNVYTVALQPDGLILAGGEFIGVTTVNTNIATPRLVRLYPDGAFDPSFDAEIPAGYAVNALAVRPDGTIWVGLTGATNGYFVRLRDNGSALPSSLTELAGGPDNLAFPYQGPLAFLQLPDGRLLLGGNFQRFGTQARRHLVCLRSDGSIDPAFGTEADGPIDSFLLQADGQVLVGGYYTSFAGRPRVNLARISPSGVLDESFAPNPNYPVYAMVQSLDSSLWFGGSFDNIAGASRYRVARTSLSGAIDVGFTASASAEPQCMALLANGEVLVGGRFQGFGGTKWIAQLAASGAERTDFQPASLDVDRISDGLIGPSGYRPLVNGIAIQPNGSILAGGLFETLGGFPGRNLARLMPAPGPAAAESLSLAGSTATWLRSGPMAELLWTTFETSTDGSTWSTPTMGMRIAGGWQASGLSSAPGTRVRARGYLSGGGRNSSCWFMETRTGPPVVLRHPNDVTARSGNTVYFHGGVAGNPSLSFQWWKDGQPLSDDTRITGTHTATLTIVSVTGADVARYTLKATNADGTALSDAAQLWVGDPLIVAHPSDVQAYEGQPASLTVQATGTGPLSYQWRLEGTPVPGAISPTLAWPRVSSTLAGTYDVVVQGTFGSITSSIARLKVLTRSLPDMFNPAPDGFVSTLAEQLDGRVLVGGAFARIGGVAQPGLARLQDNGTVDPTFHPAPNDAVLALCLEPDGRMVVAGQFTRIAGQDQPFIARLNPDGSLDASFRPALDWTVSAVAVQRDGRIVIGGEFTAVGQERHNYLARLNPDGSLDSAFTTEADGYVAALAIQPDDRILVGGGFQKIGGGVHPWLARLLPDGAVDAGFISPDTGPIYALAIQPDGRIVSGGESWQSGALNRFDASGSRDYGFAYKVQSAPGEPVYSLALQTDGSLLVGGEFSRLAGLPFENLARINTDGSPDVHFNPGARGSIYAIVLQADGRILAGGDFQVLGAQTRRNIGRLANREPAISTVTRDSASFNWTRAGTSPEITRAIAEASNDSGGWTHLGQGSRTTTGWAWANLSLPADAKVRIRGMVATSSSWWVESSWTPPGSSQQPRFISPGTILAPGEQFLLGIASTPGAILELQSIDPLAGSAWRTLQTITNRNGQFWITDADPATNSRMYRLKVVR